MHAHILGRRLGVVVAVIGLTSATVQGASAAEVAAAPVVVAAVDPDVTTSSNGTITYRDPALADGDTTTVKGLLRRVEVEDKSGHGDDALVITTDDNVVIPVTFDADIERTGVPVTARLVDGDELDSSLSGQGGDPVEVASATIQPVDAAAPAPAAQRSYVVVVTNSAAPEPTDSATLEGRIDASMQWWTTEADEAITSFARVGATVRYESALDASARCGLSGDPGALWQEAAQRFSGVSFNDPGNHLVVVVSSGCGGGTLGYGTVGSSVSDGGLVTLSDKAPTFQSTFDHEVGHNFGLAHANFCDPGCSTPDPYYDVYSVMGFGISGGANPFLPTALDSAYRSQLGIADPGEIATVGKGQSNTFDLLPRGGSTGLRGVQVSNGGSTYWVEWRNAAGRDSTSFYKAANGQDALGVGRTYPVGVTVTRQAAGAYQPLVLMARATSDGKKAGSYAAGQSFTAGDVTVTVNAIGTTANVTVASTEVTVLTPGTPTISGTHQVGTTLTASTGTWSPAPDAFAYQWLADGAAVDGATGQTFTPGSEQLGKRLSIRVTGTKAGYASRTATSAESPAVAAGDLQTALPTISGTAKVDRTLTASTGSWSPAPSFTYQWLADGSPVVGATGDTLTLAPAQRNQRITVTVTGTRPGYTTASRTSVQTAAVAAGTFQPGTPVLSGTNQVGHTIAVSPGTWSPTPDSFAYQWLVDGEPLPDATEPSLALTDDLVGHAIAVDVTVVRNGYTDGSAHVTAGLVQDGELDPGTPTISGTAAVGSRLTAATGEWSPVPDSFAYQWLADGEPIEGAIDATIDLDEAQAGAAISVEVTGRRTAYADASATSSATAPVTAGALTPGTPTITGTPKVGSTLTAVTGDWSPQPDAFTYQWLADGTAIEGATGATLVLQKAQLGSHVSVRVTGTRAGRSPASATSGPTATIARGSLTPATPALVGTAKVGNELSVMVGPWSPQPESFSYQWLADGVPVDGATSSTFTPGAAQLHALVAVRITGERDGYEPASVTSAASAVAAGDLTTAQPTISGTAKVGVPLSATTGSWSPAADLSLQWLADGQPVAGATDTVFTPGAYQAGAVIAVRVTGTRAGYATASRTSDPTAKVALGSFASGTPTVSGSAKVGSTLTASEGTWAPDPAYAYQWLADGTPISGATAKAFVLGASQVGKKMSVRVTGTLAGYTSESSTSTQTVAVASGTLTAATPKITGTAKVGKKLTVTRGTWTPTPTFSYQWYAGTKAIAKATGLSFTLTKAQKGATITVKVTGKRAGYTTVTKTSAKTAKVG